MPTDAKSLGAARTLFSAQPTTDAPLKGIVGSLDRPPPLGTGPLANSFVDDSKDFNSATFYWLQAIIALDCRQGAEPSQTSPPGHQRWPLPVCVPKNGQSKADSARLDEYGQFLVAPEHVNPAPRLGAFGFVPCSQSGCCHRAQNHHRWLRTELPGFRPQQSGSPAANCAGFPRWRWQRQADGTLQPIR